MSKIIKQFEPSTIGNGWGNYIDIENFKYDLNSMRPLPLVKKDFYSYHIDILINDNKNSKNDNKNSKNDNKNSKNDNKNSKNVNKYVRNLIIRVSSTTVVTVAFACFVYCAL
jgi:hypothetical protein